MKTLYAWLRLMRLSNLPTAWSNILMGYTLAMGDWDARVLLLLIISSCLYVGGMILNDVCDIATDRIERPDRVLPRGEIGLRQARFAAGGCLAAAVLISILVNLVDGKTGTAYFPHPTLPTTVFLILAIIAYNAGGKKNRVCGPVLMGMCRTLNVLLGMSLGGAYGPLNWYVAGCVGLFVAGITWFSREEHRDSSRRYLLAGGLAMLVAGVALACLPFSKWDLPYAGTPLRRAPGHRNPVYFGMLIFMMYPAFRRVLTALGEPSPLLVQRAVVACLLTLIMIDASLCYLFVPERPVYAMSVALLVVPAAVLGRFLRDLTRSGLTLLSLND